SDDASGVANAARGDHGDVDSTGDTRDEGEGPGQRIFRGAQKGSSMATGFEARRGDDVDAGLLERYRLLRRCRGSDREDLSATTLVQDVGRWNAENEAEDRNVRVEHHAHLIIETRRHVRCVARQGNVE